jgi:hypothetical protein
LHLGAPVDVPGALPEGPQVRAPAGLDAAVGLHRVASGVAVHLLRYDYDEAADRVPPIDDLELSVRLAGGIAGCRALAPQREVTSALARDGDWHTVRLRDVGLYTVIQLTF